MSSTTETEAPTQPKVNNQYEESAPDYKWLDLDKWRTGNRPLRIRKNPLEVEPCIK